MRVGVHLRARLSQEQYQAHRNAPREPRRPARRRGEGIRTHLHGPRVRAQGACYNQKAMRDRIRHATLQRLRTPRFNRWVGGLAAIALLIAVSAYLAHQHKPLQTADGAQIACELCLQHTAPAGTPAAAAPAGITLCVWRLVPPEFGDAPRTGDVHAYRSRAPPLA